MKYSFTDWEAYAISKQYVLPGADGSKAVHVKFKDLAGNVSAPYSATVDLATAIGQEPGISINDGALYTNQVTVTLTLPAAPSTTKMKPATKGTSKAHSGSPMPPTRHGPSPSMAHTLSPVRGS